MSKFWVASHITGIFTIDDEAEDHIHKGSRGAGFSINRGTTTWVEESDDSKNHIFFNNQEVSVDQAKISNHILNHYQKAVGKHRDKNHGVSLFHEFEVPIACGFGASASGAIGSCLAFNEFYDLDFPEVLTYNLAHSVEVEYGGGLGDVAGVIQGGWECRLKPGSPFIGETRNLLENNYHVATITFGEITTKSIIKNDNWKKQINKVGELFLAELLEEPTISNFAIASKQFSITSMLATPEVTETMRELEDSEILVGQIMLGNGVFLIYKNRSDLSGLENFIEEEICYKTVKKYD
ncbi:MAG: Pantoate kinase [Candidatus Heimdallarchaeota archaeon AB_125]|nr:MAG: Pantoate kinase [Candidatus Heimdallarchaeota archaeon AB_125]